MELETGQAASFLAMVGCQNHCVSDVMKMALDFQAVASEISPALRVSFLVSPPGAYVICRSLKRLPAFVSDLLWRSDPPRNEKVVTVGRPLCCARA